MIFILLTYALMLKDRMNAFFKTAKYLLYLTPWRRLTIPSFQFSHFYLQPRKYKFEVCTFYMFVYGKSAILNQFSSKFPKWIHLNSYFLSCEMCISAYSQVNVRDSTNFDVFYPSPKYTAMFSLPLESTANLKASLLFLQGKCLLITQEKQNVSCGTINLLLPPRWFHCQWDFLRKKRINMN